VFHIFLALQRLVNGCVLLKIYQLIDSVSGRMPWYGATLMLINAAHQIARDANVNRATRSTREE
jgi:hypothetical protein